MPASVASCVAGSARPSRRAMTMRLRAGSAKRAATAAMSTSPPAARLRRAKFDHLGPEDLVGAIVVVDEDGRVLGDRLAVAQTLRVAAVVTGPVTGEDEQLLVRLGDGGEADGPARRRVEPQQAVPAPAAVLGASQDLHEDAGVGLVDVDRVAGEHLGRRPPRHFVGVDADSVCHAGQPTQPTLRSLPKRAVGVSRRGSGPATDRAVAASVSAVGTSWSWRRTRAGHPSSAASWPSWAVARWRRSSSGRGPEAP